MKEDKTNEEKSKSKGLVITIVILAILLAGAIGYIVGEKVGIIKTPKETNESNTKKVKFKILADEKEVIIEDDSIKNNIKEKVEILNSINSTAAGMNTSQDLAYLGGALFMQDYTNETLSQDTKLDTVLRRILNGKSQLTINQSEVETKYYNLFGKSEIVHKTIGKCPMFTYNGQTKTYEGISACGGTSGKAIESYIEKYTKQNDKIYVYVRVGATSLDMESGKLFVYSNVSLQNKISEIDATNTVDNPRKNVINESNYKEFSQYKYTFNYNKDSNNYYFASIKKLS